MTLNGIVIYTPSKFLNDYILCDSKLDFVCIFKLVLENKKCLNGVLEQSPRRACVRNYTADYGAS